VAARIFEALREGGRFVAELGGKGNVRAIHAALEDAIRGSGRAPVPESSLLYFPSVAEYARVLEDAGLEVSYAILFDRPTLLADGEQGLRNWIAMFADRFIAVVPENEREPILARVEQQLRPRLYYDGAWHADYRRLRVVAKKS
jgi:hypothetical protein